MDSTCTIRKLTESDWQLLRDVRLRTLKADPLVFLSDFHVEAAYPESRWRTMLASRDDAIFVLLDGDRPAGMTGIGVWRDDPTRKTGFLWGTWIEPDHRGLGLSSLIFEARLAWARSHPDIERVIVSHRWSNEASKAAIRKHGFVYQHTKQVEWADGRDDELCYELRL